MPLHKGYNDFETTISAPLALADVTVTLADALPNIGFPIYLTIEDSTSKEILEVISLSAGTTYNVNRAQQTTLGGGPTKAFVLGSKAKINFTANHLDEIHRATKEYFDFGKTGHLVIPHFAKNQVTRLDSSDVDKAIINDVNAPAVPCPLKIKLPSGEEKILCFYRPLIGGNECIHFAEADSIENLVGGVTQPYTIGANYPLFPAGYSGYTTISRMSVIINKWLNRYEAVATKDINLASKSIVFLTCPLTSDPRIQANWTNHGVIYSITTADVHGVGGSCSPVLLLNGNAWLIYFNNNSGSMSLLTNYENPIDSAKWVSQGEVIPRYSTGIVANISIFYLDGKYYATFLDNTDATIKLLESYSPKFINAQYTMVQPALEKSQIVGYYDNTGVYKAALMPDEDNVYMFVSGGNGSVYKIGLMKAGKRA